MNQQDFLPPLELVTNDDERFMREALKEAVKAFHKDEVPVGAVVVHEGRIISRAYNQVEMLQDATAHAEMLALTAAESFFNAWRLENCTLYSTLEPCSMCAGAAILCRLPRIVWAAKDIRHGANGSFVNLFEKERPHPIHEVSICGDVFNVWSENLLKTFFKKQRETKKLLS